MNKKILKRLEERRAEEISWTELFAEIRGAMPLHEAREFWDLARAHKLAVDIQDGQE